VAGPRASFVTPPFLGAIAWEILAAPNSGLLNQWYRNLFDLDPYAHLFDIYSVEGLSGLGGRLMLGVLADRLGVKPVLVTGLMLQAIAIGSYLFVSTLGEFYALSVVFGTAYGGVMPLYAVLVREFGLDPMLAKIAGTGSAFLFNFDSRQFLIFGQRPGALLRGAD